MENKKKEIVDLDDSYGLNDDDLPKRVSDLILEIEGNGFSENLDTAAFQIKTLWILLGQDKERYKKWIKMYNEESEDLDEEIFPEIMPWEESLNTSIKNQLRRSGFFK